MSVTNRSTLFQLFNGTNSSAIVNNSLTEEEEEEVTAKGYLFLAVELCLMIVILFGNGLTLIAIFTTPSLQTITYRFVASLAVADLLVGFSLPYHGAFFISPDLASYKYPCFIRFTTIILTAAASILSLLWISIDRYIAVIYPLHYPNIMTADRSIAILTVLWLQAMIIGFAPFYCGQWTSHTDDCLLEEVMPVAYRLVALSGQYVFLSVVMIALYSRVFYVAHQHRIKINATINQLDQANNTLSKDTKTTKTLATVLGVFLFSWTPFFCLVFLQASGSSGGYLDTLYVVGILMGVFNSCLNPVIYCWKSAEFRRAYSKLIKRVCQREP